MSRDIKTGTTKGPVYPAWDNLAKFRKLADKAGGVAKLDAKTSDAYSLALFANIKRENLALATKGNGPAHPCPCASGSYANTGEGVLAAVSAKIARECAEALKRTQNIRLAKCNWKAEYEAAMIETRKARAQSAPVAVTISPAPIVPANVIAQPVTLPATAIAIRALITTPAKRATKSKTPNYGLGLKAWQIAHANNRARIEARNVLR